MSAGDNRKTYCRFAANGTVSYGLVEDRTIFAIDGSPFGEHAKTGASYGVEQVRLLPPVLPGTFYAVGSNYRNHILGMAAKRGREPRFYDAPRVGYRANSALIGHDDEIVKPASAGPKFEYEAELVAVIGRTARKVSADEGEACIFGWTIGNDISERDWQASDVTNLRSKNADTFKPMGPWIVTGVRLEDMTTNVRVNGRLVHSFPTGEMLFRPGEVIGSISRQNTLSPGDVLWLGTDEVPEALNIGDVVEIEITGIGVLRNRVVAESN